MLKNILRMTKSSLKLLLRNKGFIFVGILIPILAPLLINVLYGNEEIDTKNAVYELESADKQMAYQVNFSCFPVKVYDASADQAGEDLCERMAKAGLFQIFRVDASALSQEALTASIEKAALEDKVGAIVVIKADFSKDILNGNSGGAIQLYKTGEDERFDIFKDYLEQLLEIDNEYGSMAKDKDTLYEILESGRKKGLRSELTLLAVDNQAKVDYVKTREFGYCIAISTIAFVFGGVLILGIIMKEKQNKVYYRIMMTRATHTTYLVSKLVLIICVSAIQTLVMSVSFGLFVTVEIGMNIWQFACLSFLEGLIFSSLSVCAGLCLSSVAQASFLSFTLWTVTSLMSGTYFDIANASEAYHRLAMLMPQRWTLIAATKLQNNDLSAYPVIFVVTVSYLIVILVMGILGLKMNEKE